ncbi:hypothetical protein TNCV_4167321 [Trichonephila clavipes]|nr:hypothetical protein TNCV_4167321 [Trichonephila clavipes]
MGFFVSLHHKQDGGKDGSLGFVKRIRNDVKHFKPNNRHSEIKEIILDVRFPKYKHPIRYRYSFKRYSLEFWWQRWDKKLAFRTRERRKILDFYGRTATQGEKEIFGRAVLRFNSASEKESVLLIEDQTDL